jgi:hypothetical protein
LISVCGFPSKAKELFAIRDHFFHGQLCYSPAFWLNPYISRGDVICLFHAFWSHHDVIPDFYRLTRPWGIAFQTKIWTWNCHRALINAFGYVVLFDAWYDLDYIPKDWISSFLQNFS